MSEKHMERALSIVEGLPLSASAVRRNDQWRIAKSIAAALTQVESETQEAKFLAFGNGNLGVDTGTVGQRPAVIIRTLDHVGPIGELLPADKQRKGREPAFADETYLTFPTEDQATLVANALVGIAPSSSKREVTEVAVRQAGSILMQHGLNAPEQVIHQAARAVLEAACKQEAAQ
jgi:hypothetical protein